MSYWQKRQQQLNKSLEKDEERLKKRLSSYFDTEYRKLEKQIAAYYEQYGTDNVIQYRRLMEELPEEDKRLLIEQMDAFAEKYPEYAHLMPIRESIYKLNRLEGLQYSVRMQQLEIGAVEIEQITEHLNRQAALNANTVAETLGYGKNFYSEDSELVKKIVNSKWSNGKDFSERIWGNTEKLAQYLNTDIAQAFVRGDSYARIVRQLRQRFQKVTRNDAYRLVYTEGTHVMNEARAAAFEEDTEEYVFRVQYDKPRRNGWRDICDDLDGKIFKWSERVAGENFPPMHAWCHCTATPHISDREKWLDDYEKRHGNGEAQKVANRLGSESDLQKPVNKFGEEIIFDDSMSDARWDKNKDMISRLAAEYDTRLATVSSGSRGKVGASAVDLAGNMVLSSRQISTTIHEFAHSISMSNLKKYGLADDGEFWKEIKKIRAQYRNAYAKGETKSISGYADSELDEFFAESFALAKMRELGIEIPFGYGSDVTYSQQVLDVVDKYFKKSVVKDGDSDIIKREESRLKMDLQFFAESDIKKQESNSLKRAIRKYEKRIKEHEDYLEHPETHCSDWNEKSRWEQEGLKKHWKKEIRNFNQSIQDRIDELKARGDYDD